MRIQMLLIGIFCMLMLTQCVTGIVDNKRVEFFQKDRSTEMQWKMDDQTRMINCPLMYANEIRGYWVYQVRTGDHPLYLILSTEPSSAQIVDTVPAQYSYSTPTQTAKPLQLLVTDRFLPWGIQSLQDSLGNPLQAVLWIQGQLLGTLAMESSNTVEKKQPKPVVYFQAKNQSHSTGLTVSAHLPKGFSFVGALILGAYIPAVAIDAGIIYGIYTGGAAIGITTKGILIAAGIWVVGVGILYVYSTSNNGH